MQYVMKQLDRIPRIDIFMLLGEIGKRGLGKDRCGRRVRLAARRPRCLVGVLLGGATRVPGLALSLPGLESQLSQCPRPDYILFGKANSH